jgi:hypothetical protein
LEREAPPEQSDPLNLGDKRKREQQAVELVAAVAAAERLYFG